MLLLVCPTPRAMAAGQKPPPRWAGLNRDALTRSLEQLNSALSQSSEVALVVFDALDRMQGQLAHSVSRYLRGLLELLLDARQLKGLRFKVFLREDMTNMPNVLSFPDASKLVNEAFISKWIQRRHLCIALA